MDLHLGPIKLIPHINCDAHASPRTFPGIFPATTFQTCQSVSDRKSDVILWRIVLCNLHFSLKDGPMVVCALWLGRAPL